MATLVQKYYTPELNRFHVGFEFEAIMGWQDIRESQLLPKLKDVVWVRSSIPPYGKLDISALNYLIHNKMVRLLNIEYK